MRIVKRAVVALALAMALALLVAGCDYGSGTTDGTEGGSTGTTDDNTVIAENLEFSPSTLEVEVGETVVFTNEDSATHDVEIEGENLGNISQGESVEWTAEEAGTYSYVCTIHPQMQGTIVVK